MVPLIDMFFLLLVFFIFGVFSMTTQQGILVDLPAAQSAVPSKEENTVTISLTAQGALFWNQKAATPEILTRLLVDTERERPESVIVIRADRQAQHGKVMEILDAVRGAGLQRVSFQTASEDR